MALCFQQAGAQGLVLFNRFYQPDFDLDLLEVVPRLELSRQQELLQPLTWVAILSGRVPLDYAVTGGVKTYLDVLKAMMAGARIVEVASLLLKQGPECVRPMLADMQSWMEEKSYESIAQMQGSMCQGHVSDPAAFERANYMRTLQSYLPLETRG